MKSERVVLLILLCLQLGMMGQSWCTPGSRWYFKHNNFWTGPGYLQMTYLKDTVYSGHTWNKIHEKIVATNNSGTQVYYFEFYTITNNKLVLVNGALTPTDTPVLDTLFNFSANIGDSWRMFPTTSCGSSKVLVEDTGSRVIQGVKLKWLRLKYTSKDWVKYDTAMERLGSLILFTYNPYNVCKHLSDADKGGALQCFSDHQISDHKSNFTGQCDFVTSTGDEFSVNHRLEVFPMPANDFVRIEFPDLPVSAGVSVDISSLDGRSQIRIADLPQNGRISVSALPAGLYVMHFYINGHPAGSRKLVKE